jgi:hypothetical protein
MRIYVERSFGALKNRFKILAQPRFKENLVVVIFTTAIVLHNFIGEEQGELMYDLEVGDEVQEREAPSQVLFEPVEQLNPIPDYDEGIAMRNAIKDRLWAIYTSYLR